MAISRLRNVYIYIDCFFKFCIIVMSMRTFFLFFRLLFFSRSIALLILAIYNNMSMMMTLLCRIRLMVGSIPTNGHQT